VDLQGSPITERSRWFKVWPALHQQELFHARLKISTDCAEHTSDFVCKSAQTCNGSNGNQDNNQSVFDQILAFFMRCQGVQLETNLPQ
jgi:hypothetical protein